MGTPAWGFILAVMIVANTVSAIGSPQEVFEHAANLFVAGFIGVPQMNFYDAVLVREDGKYTVALEAARIILSDEKQAALVAKNTPPRPVTLGVRPEHILLADEGKNRIHGTVDVSEIMRSAIHLHVNACGHDTVIVVQAMDLQGSNRVIISTGQPIAFTFGGNVVHLFNKETGENLEE